ncbi:MAG: hypothetical protein JXP37_03310 [Coriobacteriia bacterium]|nr:hypothetical protein [Coriobacteriia bacterium]
MAPGRRIPIAAAGAALVVMLAASAALVAHLSHDPFADLPDNPSVTVNLAGVFPADGEDPLQKPRGIAIAGNRVYVVETGADRVSVFDRYGKRKGEITLLPAQGRERVVATYVACTDDGRIAVVDLEGPRVMVFRVTARGPAEPLFELAIGAEGDEPMHPGAITYADGVFYVADSRSQTIQMYDDAGEHIGVLGDGLQEPPFYPGGIVVRDEDVVVTSANDSRILTLGRGAADTFDEIASSLIFPDSMTAVGDDRLAVVDSLGDAVYVYDADWRATHAISARQVAGANIQEPSGVAWEPGHRRLYVVDVERGSVYVFNVRL